MKVSQIGGGHTVPDALLESVARAIYGALHGDDKVEVDFAMEAEGKLMPHLRNVRTARKMARAAVLATLEFESSSSHSQKK